MVWDASSSASVPHNTSVTFQGVDNDPNLAEWFVYLARNASPIWRGISHRSEHVPRALEGCWCGNARRSFGMDGVYLGGLRCTRLETEVR